MRNTFLFTMIIYIPISIRVNTSIPHTTTRMVVSPFFFFDEYGCITLIQQVAECAN